MTVKFLPRNYKCACGHHIGIVQAKEINEIGIWYDCNACKTTRLETISDAERNAINNSPTYSGLWTFSGDRNGRPTFRPWDQSRAGGIRSRVRRTLWAGYIRSTDDYDGESA